MGLYGTSGVDNRQAPSLLSDMPLDNNRSFLSDAIVNSMIESRDSLKVPAIHQKSFAERSTKGPSLSDGLGHLPIPPLILSSRASPHLESSSFAFLLVVYLKYDTQEILESHIS